ncbi:MAG TPA: hypothetical protein VEB64_04475, partial [Azospirillaceae bacterium]|nr:hypothetical protein [Azospirillaceae bacterium]
HAPGDTVDKGAVVAEIVVPGGARIPLVARASGILWARTRQRVVASGDVVASIAGREPLTGGKGGLLTS